MSISRCAYMGSLTISSALMYASSFYYMSEWFVERRGLANGVIFAGTSADSIFSQLCQVYLLLAGTAWGGLVLPLILPSIIDKYGIARTLRFYAIINSSVLALMLPFIRGRLPETSAIGPSRPRMNNFFWIKDKTFWVINVANTLQGLAYFVPLLWLPSM